MGLFTPEKVLFHEHTEGPEISRVDYIMRKIGVEVASVWDTISHGRTTLKTRIPTFVAVMNNSLIQFRKEMQGMHETYYQQGQETINQVLNDFGLSVLNIRGQDLFDEKKFIQLWMSGKVEMSDMYLLLEIINTILINLQDNPRNIAEVMTYYSMTRTLLSWMITGKRAH